MTDKKKRKGPLKIDLTFKEALARFTKTDKREIVDSLAGEMLTHRQQVEKRIAAAREEIDGGARPRKRRFRL
jgi:hypothetical protein